MYSRYLSPKRRIMSRSGKNTARPIHPMGRPNGTATRGVSAAKRNECVELDHDMRIADNFNWHDVDLVEYLWPLFRSFAHVPVLVLREENSELLTG